MASVADGPAKLTPIRFQCPGCRGTLTVKGEYAGQVTRCRCGIKIRVPGSDKDDAAAISHDEYGAVDPYVEYEEFMSAYSVGTDPQTGRPVSVANLKPRYRQGRKTVFKRDDPNYGSHGGGIEFNGEMIAGAMVMLAAILWFFGGLYVDVIFYAPPILFLMGLVLFIKGSMSE